MSAKELARDPLRGLLAASARLAAGEAEVARTYFNASSRTRESDCRWLARQCYKEYRGFTRRFEQLGTLIAQGADRAALLALSKEMHEELSHLSAFADAHDAIAAGSCPRTDLSTLELDGDWPENIALSRLRRIHRERHGRLGELAHTLTEGGWGALYREGIRLEGRGGADDLIATACKKVHADEIEHMASAFAELGRHGPDEAAWSTLIELTAEQMRSRIRMRNAQLTFPVPEQRIEAILGGDVEPYPLPGVLERLLAV